MAGVPPLEATSLILDSEKARLVKAVVANTIVFSSPLL
jgi:hypothetical protein